MLVVGTSATTFYEPVDMAQMLVGEPDIILRPLEGVVVTAEAAVVTTGNPSSDLWSVVIDWDEFTLP